MLNIFRRGHLEPSFMSLQLFRTCKVLQNMQKKPYGLFPAENPVYAIKYLAFKI